MMTMSQAAALRMRWKERADLSSTDCEHPIQELARSARCDKDYLKGYLMGTYQCCECGEALVYIRKPPPFSKMPPID
jgi:hypothetical protein